MMNDHEVSEDAAAQPDSSDVANPDAVNPDVTQSEGNPRAARPAERKRVSWPNRRRSRNPVPSGSKSDLQRLAARRWDSLTKLSRRTQPGGQ